MRAVVDTNVIVSGILTPNGPPGRITQMVISGELLLLVDARTISEYARVLRRPELDLRTSDVDAFFDQVMRLGVIVATSPLPDRLPHADDEPFLEIAVAAGAEYLVTGNTAHFPKRLRQGVAVVSPREFIEAYRERIAVGRRG
jgi:putative PIN family toxin of toxin-antitoxin system